MLLSTRASILNRLEAHVATACSVEDTLWHLAQEDYDLLFLCHTVDQDKRMRSSESRQFPVSIAEGCAATRRPCAEGHDAYCRR